MLDFINPAQRWANSTPPERKWLWRELVPAGRLTLLSGNGGIGKSLLAQQLATHVGLGTPLLGHAVTEGAVLAIFAEDDADELHRRQADIAAATFEDVANLERLSLLPAENVDSQLWTEKGTPTAFFEEVVVAADAMRPALVVLDNAAALFGGNELDRNAVTKFCRTLEREICFRTGAAVLLLSHPSRAGMVAGDGLSGSTAWNNAVRSRLYLRASDPKRDKTTDTDVRILESAKANLGKMGGKIQLRWSSGMLIAVEADEIDEATRSAQIDADVLQAAAKVLSKNESLSPHANQPSYFPKPVKRIPCAARWSIKEIEDSYRRLLDTGDLEIRSEGRKGHEVQRVHIRAHVPELLGA